MQWSMLPLYRKVVGLNLGCEVNRRYKCEYEWFFISVCFSRPIGQSQADLVHMEFCRNKKKKCNFMQQRLSFTALFQKHVGQLLDYSLSKCLNMLLCLCVLGTELSMRLYPKLRLNRMNSSISSFCRNNGLEWVCAAIKSASTILSGLQNYLKK